MQKKASRVGFDWGSPGPVLDKFEEEIGEMREAIDSGRADDMEDELGDLLFQVVFHSRLAAEIGAPLLATNDCHFLDRAHHEAHDILMALQQTGRQILVGNPFHGVPNYSCLGLSPGHQYKLSGL